MNLFKRFSRKHLAVTLSLVALNLIIGSLVSFLKLPIYLDSSGIVISTLLLGWSYGVICSLLTVSIGFFLINPYLPAYVATSLAIVMTTYILRRFNLFSTYLRAVLSGLILAIISAFISAPVTAYLFGGSTLSGNDLITAYFLSIGNNIVDSVLLAGLSSEPVDKIIVALLSFQVLKSFPKSFVERNGFRLYKD